MLSRVYVETLLDQLVDVGEDEIGGLQCCEKVWIGSYDYFDASGLLGLEWMASFLYEKSENCNCNRNKGTEGLSRTAGKEEKVVILGEQDYFAHSPSAKSKSGIAFMLLERVILLRHSFCHV